MSADTFDPRRGGGAEYAPQYAPQQPSMRPVSPQTEPTSPYAPAPEPWGQQAAGGPLPASAPAQAPPPVAPSKMPHECLLSRPYRAHGDDVQHIVFREPTVMEIRRLGYPFQTALNAQGVPSAIQELPDVVGNWISVLSKPPLPPSTVNAMTPDDFARCSTCVTRFFLG